MNDIEKVFPTLRPFSSDSKGQSGYAAMIGCVFMHFLGGDAMPPKRGWDHWKEFYYLESNKAGLTAAEASKFLNQACLILCAMGIIDPPEELDSNETIH